MKKVFNHSVFVLCVAAGLVLPVTVAMAASGPVPALMSAKAQRSLLVDVARAGNRLVAVGERGHIVLSDDSGKSWRQAKVPVRSLLTAIYFVDAKRGWVVGHESTVLATIDGGESWKIQHYKEFDSSDPGSDSSMTDTGDDPPMADDGMQAGVSREGVPLLDVWFADNNTGLAVGAFGLMLRTSDGGNTWSDVSEMVRNPDGWHFNAIAADASGKVVVIAGEKGTLYRSVDGGLTFIPVKSGYEGSFFGATAARDGTFYTFGLQGSLYRSIDNGVAWHRVDTGVSSGLNDACQLADGRVMIAGNGGVLLTGNRDVSTFVLERRPDRQSVVSCVPVADNVVLVGEGGAKLANP